MGGDSSDIIKLILVVLFSLHKIFFLKPFEVRPGLVIGITFSPRTVYMGEHVRARVHARACG